MFAVCAVRLEPIYKDFGMKGKIAWLRQVDQAYERAMKATREEMNKDVFGGFKRILALPEVLAFSAMFTLGLMALISLWWIAAAIGRRRGQESTLILLPWTEGWMARILLAVSLPTIALAVAIALAYPSVHIEDVPGIESLWPVPISVLILGLLAMAALAFRVLHHRYDEHAGQQTGMFRFVFKTPAAVKAWTRKYLLAAFIGQLIFLLCLFSLNLILYEITFGCNICRVDKLPVLNISHEQAAMERVAADLRKAAFESQRIPESGKNRM